MIGELATSSKLKKAYIAVLNAQGKTQDEIPILFNPREYSLNKSNKFQDTTIPGLSSPITQFVSGSAESLTMDLFFDTYEKRTDVREYTDKIDTLLKIDKDIHAPPICEFIWGGKPFKAVVERVNKKFTMFLSDGVPVRATLSVTFKEYKTITEQLQNPPRQSADRTKRRVIKQGDTLWLIADREYGDPGLWRPIAEINKIDNPRILETGKEIIIPPLR
jgi:LysM repeat protein